MLRSFLAVLATASLIGCGDVSSPPPSGSTQAPVTDDSSTTPTAQSSKAIIPKDVTYRIIDQNTVPGIKRSLDIELNKKVPKSVLTAIAHKLKSSDSASYERTFIGYYLPDMKRNAGYWATTHFNPDLDVRILGLTTDQEAALTKTTEDPSRDVVGNWLDERPFVGHKVSIFTQDSKLYMETTFKDGSQGKYELIEKPSPLGRRFEKVDGSAAGDHWILDSGGNLQLRDNEGIISTARKLQ
ncbi:MAG: hypothetical protein IH899_06510 [Planctomycetes bacterium]|nr:hypothetical protein [Planctomycetota bacterium]